MADLDEIVRQAERALATARPKKPARNQPCWCGSGRKYKGCHWDADQAVRALPEMSSILQEVAGPVPGEPSLARLQTAVRLAAVAWNASRRPDTEAALAAAAERLTTDPAHRAPILRSLQGMSARAARWPDDPRVVVKAEVVPDGDGGFTIRAATAVGEAAR